MVVSWHVLGIGDVEMKKRQFLTPGSLQSNGETGLEQGFRIMVSTVEGEVEGMNRASNRVT